MQYFSFRKILGFLFSFQEQPDSKTAQTPPTDAVLEKVGTCSCSYQTIFGAFGCAVMTGQVCLVSHHSSWKAWIVVIGETK